MSKEDYYKVIRFLMESTPETLEGLVKNKDGTPNKKTPVWVLNVVSAINADIRYGRTYTVDSLFDRVSVTHPTDRERSKRTSNQQ